MWSREQNQKFILMMVTNNEYLHKQLAVKNVVQFLQENNFYTTKEGFRYDSSTQTYNSFVELLGMIPVGQTLVKLSISIPKLFPSASPLFHIIINPNSQKVSKDQKYKQNSIISVERIQQEDVINLKIPCLTTQWNPKKTLIQVYRQAVAFISHPPLVIQERFNQSNFSQYSFQKTSNNNLRSITNQIGSKLSDLTRKYQVALDSRQKLQYFMVRSHYLQNNLPKMSKRIQEKTKNIQKMLQYLTQEVEKSNQSSNCDNLLQISPIDKQIIYINCQKQCLKEAYSSLKAKMAKDSSHLDVNKSKFKIIFSKLFINRSNFLKL